MNAAGTPMKFGSTWIDSDGRELPVTDDFRKAEDVRWCELPEFQGAEDREGLHALCAFYGVRLAILIGPSTTRTQAYSCSWRRTSFASQWSSPTSVD
jgi:hypothetical protein